MDIKSENDLIEIKDRFQNLIEKIFKSLDTLQAAIEQLIMTQEGFDKRLKKLEKK